MVVLGAGSGVGTAAIQIARLLNARVIATAGDENKMAKGLELGANFVINHYKQKISDEVRKLTEKVGATLRRVDTGKASLLPHADAMASLDAKIKINLAGKTA